MGDGYVKLLSSILDSSIWSEPDDVVRVWITMLAMADRDGFVGASISGISRRTHTVSKERTAECIALFEAPDPDSRSEENEGRRIAKVERGWLILNYKKIRDMHGEESRKQAKREWWERNRGKSRLDNLDSSGSSEISSNGSALSGSGSVDSGSDARDDALLPRAKNRFEGLDTPCPDVIEPLAKTLDLIREQKLPPVAELIDTFISSRRSSRRKSGNWPEDFHAYVRKWNLNSKNDPKKSEEKPTSSVTYPNAHEECKRLYRIKLEAEKRRRDEALAAGRTNPASQSQNEVLDPKAAPQ